MRIARLPNWLEPVGEFDLIRLGRDRDAGYLVDSRDVADTDVLVSLGVNDDWSFEEDFLKRRSVPLHAFDGTVDQAILSKRLIKGILSGKDVKQRLKAWRQYSKFFTASRHHHKKMVGLNASPGFVTLQHILTEYTRGKVFLKIDIEGWEYRIFDDILANANKIGGLVIEVHDVDLHLDRLEDFITKLPHRIAHLHCNGFAPVTDNGIPLVIEITFSPQNPISAKPIKLPHALDRPSAPHHQPSEVHFIN